MYENVSRAPIDFHLAGAPRGEWLISVITNGNILYLVTFKWLLTGTYGLPHTFNALTQYIYYLNSLVYHIFARFFIIIFTKNSRRGGALAPSMDAPPLVSSQTVSPIEILLI